MFFKLIFLLSLFFPSSNASASVTLEDLGVIPDPTVPEKLIMCHADFSIDPAARDAAKGLWRSAEAFLDKYDFPDVPKEKHLILWRPILLSIKTAAFLGNKDAIDYLADVFIGGILGVEKNNEAYKAVNETLARDLPESFKSEPFDEEIIKEYPGAIAERARKAREAGEASKALSTDDIMIDSTLVGERDPLLKRR